MKKSLHLPDHWVNPQNIKIQFFTEFWAEKLLLFQSSIHIKKKKNLMMNSQQTTEQKSQFDCTQLTRNNEHLSPHSSMDCLLKVFYCFNKKFFLLEPGFFSTRYSQLIIEVYNNCLNWKPIRISSPFCWYLF